MGASGAGRQGATGKNQHASRPVPCKHSFGLKPSFCSPLSCEQRDTVEGSLLSSEDWTRKYMESCLQERALSTEVTSFRSYRPMTYISDIVPASAGYSRSWLHVWTGTPHSLILNQGSTPIRPGLTRLCLLVASPPWLPSCHPHHHECLRNAGREYQTGCQSVDPLVCHPKAPVRLLSPTHSRCRQAEPVCCKSKNKRVLRHGTTWIFSPASRAILLNRSFWPPKHRSKPIKRPHFRTKSASVAHFAWSDLMPLT